ncbi:MAG: PucR family transcriptional regulator ligand-binding domain-containing protein [Pelosinus sp.]|nr:PucR family transcriptional regulator ligand-binding domain-containing protein [Pelosinus sp.]
MVSCREIAQLSSFKKSNLVAGNMGLDRLVRWVHFIDLPDVLPWVQGGELLIITGIGLEGNLNRLTLLVQGLIKKNLAGLIINIGPYIKKTPEEIIELANSANFPIFELPWEIKLVEVTQEICSYIVLKQTEKRSIADFFEQLLLQPIEDELNLIQRASVYGYDLSIPQQVAILNPTRLTTYIQDKKIKDERKLVALKTQLEQYVRDVLNMQEIKVLSIFFMNTIVLLLPAENKAASLPQNMKLVTDILMLLTKRFADLGIIASLGGCAGSLCEVRRSYAQATKALCLSNSPASNKSVYAYDELGIYKLLLEISPVKLREYYQEVIEPLDKHDKQHDMNLAATLLAFFEENGNAAKTAKQLYIHRNTLDYRLKKIEEITSRRLSDPYDRLTLQLGVIVGRQLKAEDTVTNLL